MANKYCPNGNYWENITDFYSERELFFCDCDRCKGEVYELRPVKITKKVRQTVIDKIKKTFK